MMLGSRPIEWYVSFSIIITSAMALIWWLVKSTIRSELYAFRVELIKELNGTYVRSGECQLRHADTEHRIERLEDGCDTWGTAG